MLCDARRVGVDAHVCNAGLEGLRKARVAMGLLGELQRALGGGAVERIDIEILESAVLGMRDHLRDQYGDQVEGEEKEPPSPDGRRRASLFARGVRRHGGKQERDPTAAETVPGSQVHVLQRATAKLEEAKERRDGAVGALRAAVLTAQKNGPEQGKLLGCGPAACGSAGFGPVGFGPVGFGLAGFGPAGVMAAQ